MFSLVLGCGLDPQFGKETDANVDFGEAEPGPDGEDSGDPGDTDADADADAGPEDGRRPGTVCDDGESYYDCDLDCVSSAALGAIGNGTCDDGSGGSDNFACEEYGNDAGDCDGGAGSDGGPPSGDCPEGQTPDCSGTCQDDSTIASYLGDGFCDDGLFGADLDCVEFAYDNGDCVGTGDGDADGSSPDGGTEECPSGFIVNCAGTCSPAYWLADGYCDEVLNCAEFSYDEGDCEASGDTDSDGTTPDDGGSTGECEEGESLDCVDTCHSTSTIDSYLGDGYCDDGVWGGPNLDCIEYGYDDGDCSGGEDADSDGTTPDDGGSTGECEEGESLDCIDTCHEDWKYDSYPGDGICDDGLWGPDLDCAEFEYDGGDCDPGSDPSSGGTDTPLECGGTYLGTSTGDSVAAGSTLLGASMFDLTCALTGHDVPDEAFTWIAPLTGTYSFSSAGSDFDTVIAIFDSDCSTELECNDDTYGESTSTSTIEYYATGGTTYVVVIDGYYFYSEGSYVLSINPVGV